MARSRRRRGIYLLAGIGIGLLLVPSIRKRVLTVIEETNPEIYHEFSNLKRQLMDAFEAGVEAARQKEQEFSKPDNLVKFESDEESPNYIV